MMKSMEINGCLVDIRVRIRREQEPVFGSGICMLLRKTELHQSLKAAADEMGMNYKKALYIVRRAEAFYGEALLLRSTGGAGGGGSHPTPLALELMEQFERLEADLMRHVEKLTAQMPRLFNR